LFFVCILALEVWKASQKEQCSYLETMKEFSGLIDDYYSDYDDDDY